MTKLYKERHSWTNLKSGQFLQVWAMISVLDINHLKEHSLLGAHHLGSSHPVDWHLGCIEGLNHDAT